MLLKEPCDWMDLGNGKCVVKFGSRECSLILNISKVKKKITKHLIRKFQDISEKFWVGWMGEIIKK